MVNQDLIVIGACLLTFGILSRLLQNKFISPPLLFSLIGLIMGPLGLDLVHIDFNLDAYRVTAELTLVLFLFIEAAQMDMRFILKDTSLSTRLLFLSLPLKLVLTTYLAVLYFPTFSLWQAAVVATALTSVDISLIQSVITNPNIPARIRQGLMVEGGLNDGIILPCLLLALALASSTQQAVGVMDWVEYISFEIMLGPFIGIGLGYFSGRLIRFASKRRYINDLFKGISVVGVAVMTYSITEMMNGNGFIATFAAGLTLGNTARDICHKLYEFGEAEGEVLRLITFFIFGAMMLPMTLHNVTVEVLMFALLTLTFVQIIPIIISLAWTGLSIRSKVFIGSFSPRGLPSILFGLLIIHASGVHKSEELFSIILITVFLSLCLHAVRVKFGMSWYEKYFKKQEGKKIKKDPKKAQEVPANITIL